MRARYRLTSVLPSSFPRNRCTSATTARGSHGLARYPSHPTSIAFSRSDASACAVSAMIGISRVCGSCFSTCVASQPSMTGNRDVHQDQIRLFGPRLRDPFLAVQRLGDRVAEVPQDRGIDDAVVFVVFDEKYRLAVRVMRVLTHRLDLDDRCELERESGDVDCIRTRQCSIREESDRLVASF